MTWIRSEERSSTAAIMMQRRYNQILNMQMETMEAGWELMRTIAENAREDSVWDAPIDQNPAGDW